MVRLPFSVLTALCFVSAAAALPACVSTSEFRGPKGQTCKDDFGGTPTNKQCQMKSKEFKKKGPFKSKRAHHSCPACKKCEKTTEKTCSKKCSHTCPPSSECASMECYKACYEKAEETRASETARLEKALVDLALDLAECSGEQSTSDTCTNVYDNCMGITPIRNNADFRVAIREWIVDPGAAVTRGLSHVSQR